jgi:hypothetical protein
VDLAAAEAFELAADPLVVRGQELVPAPVAQPAARSVEPTRSVNRTVAKTRSTSGVPPACQEMLDVV